MEGSRRPKLMASGHSDHFRTPAHALLPLLPHLPRDWRIWEPAPGAGDLAQGLTEQGYWVGATRGDFLREQPAWPWDAIVTNPPYSLKTAFLERAYELRRPFAFLLPITVLDSAKRQALFQRYGVELLLLNRRINYGTPSGRKSSAWFMSCWVTHGLSLPAQLTFTTLENT